MKTIDVIGDRNSRGFTTTFGDGITGVLKYPKWFSTQATVTIGDSTYEIVPKGFWKFRYEIIKDNKLLLTCTYSWNGCKLTKPNDTERPMMIQSRGFMKGGYALVNHNGELLAEVISDFRWKKFTQDYKINYEDTFGYEEFDKVLMFLTIYYFIAMQTAAVTS